MRRSGAVCFLSPCLLSVNLEDCVFVAPVLDKGSSDVHLVYVSLMTPDKWFQILQPYQHRDTFDTQNVINAFPVNFCVPTHFFFYMGNSCSGT